MNEIRSMLELIVPRLTQQIIAGQSISKEGALTLLYRSELYRQLEREETKLWHLSVPTLYEMWQEEQQTGRITYPEEA